MRDEDMSQAQEHRYSACLGPECSHSFSQRSKKEAISSEIS